MITAKKLEKSFGDFTAVRELDLEIVAGETLGLLGPNGAGKTTTINMMVGLLSPTSGQITIGDRFRPSDPEARRMIGIAPQSLSLYDEMSAHENLSFFGGLYGLESGQLKERIDWSLDFAGLTDRRNDRVKTYSGGMKRRLNLACGLIHEPQIVFLDEPTVGVDPQSRNHIFESILELKQQGMTIIYTTHYMEEAQRLCDRVAIVDHGSLLAIDKVSNLLTRFGGNAVISVELDPSFDRQVELPGTRDDLTLRIESEDPLQEIRRLQEQGIEFQSLQINQADLESVFLSLTGRSLRD